MIINAHTCMIINAHTCMIINACVCVYALARVDVGLCAQRKQINTIVGKKKDTKMIYELGVNKNLIWDVLSGTVTLN